MDKKHRTPAHRNPPAWKLAWPSASELCLDAVAMEVRTPLTKEWLISWQIPGIYFLFFSASNIHSSMFSTLLVKSPSHDVHGGLLKSAANYLERWTFDKHSFFSVTLTELVCFSDSMTGGIEQYPYVFPNLTRAEIFSNRGISVCW